MAEARYEWTGEFRVPDLGEWFLLEEEPTQFKINDDWPDEEFMSRNNCQYFILRRIAPAEPEGED